MTERGEIENNPMSQFNREANMICSTLVAEIERTTVWVEIAKVAGAIRHVRLQQRQHNAEHEGMFASVKDQARVRYD